MLPIKSLKIHVDNHSKIPIPNPQKKKKKQKTNSYHSLYQKTHAI